MRRGLSVLVALILIGGGVARGQTASAEANTITHGKQAAPGVEVTAATYRASNPAVTRSRPGAGPATAAAPASSRPPVPVAISAHNCVPRLDPRGVSLSLEFAEGGGDCISFVSPAPVRTADRGPRRQAPRPRPEQLAQSAYERVISLAARPSVAAAPARIGLTGLTSFFWVGNDLPPVSATAGVRGLSVTAEARPVRYLWDFDDGTTFDTTHPGRPWTREQDGDIAHLYETEGRYEPNVEVVWAARWRVNGGRWRDLGYFSNTGSLEYPVREMVAALVRGR